MSALQCATTMVIACPVDTSQATPGGPVLSERGRRQAADLADLLSSRRVAHVWTSTTATAALTGAWIAERLGVGSTVSEGLRELDLSEVADPEAPLLRSGAEGTLVEPFTETLQEIADIHPGETVLIVSHEGAITRGVHYLTGARPPQVPPQPGASEPRRHRVEVLADADGWACTIWVAD